MAIRGIERLAQVVAGKTNLTEPILFVDTSKQIDLGAGVVRLPRALDGGGLLAVATGGVPPPNRPAWASRAAGLPLLPFVNLIDRLAARAEPRSLPCIVFGR